ncbi:UNKNOWN [Stylonychia lemnae]|uniref:Uncharacterized protein n=1 Tax=Stylonychia lemnae TaxID=5949 RepID=A0A078ASP2_STYLE|nr:UNKNOWN [Stylonychia lemnae]|eukprot:CDW85016.1 UNKNOWN [Stylonychia lemnae]
MSQLNNTPQPDEKSAKSSLGQSRPTNQQQAVLKVYKRGQIFFKLGLFMFLTMPPSIFYYKKHQKDLYARGIIKDMKRMSEKGKSMHDIPKYTTDVPMGKRH